MLIRSSKLAFFIENAEFLDIENEKNFFKLNNHGEK